jgi:NAD(P)-dependent dehydrogenase (short-subunit alcohol dehydrogenase family)
MKPSPLDFLKLSKLPPHQTTTLMIGKTVLITGATAGIGLATAHRFAQGKANLILLARNQDKIDSLAQVLREQYKIEVHTYIADLSNLKDLQKTLDRIVNANVNIDVLINNAGVYSTKKQLTQDGYELALTVNHLASLFITEALLPLLKKRPGSRVIQVNSEGHRFSGFSTKDPHFVKRWYTGLRSYGSSKSAQLHTVWELAPTYASQGVMLNAMHPGEVQSNIGLNNGWLYRTFKKFFINLMLKNVNRSSDALYYLASEPSLGTTYGQYFYLTHPATPAKHAQKNEHSTRVYQISKVLLQTIINR